MQLAQALAHHAAGHLGEPEIGSRQNTENGGYAHDHVEMANNEIGCVEIDVDGGLREEEAAHAAADEHGDKTEGKKRGGGYPDVGSIKAAQPNQGHYGGRNGDGEGREGKQQRGKRVHATDEHVVSPDHVAQEADGDHRVDDDLGAQERLAHAGDQDMGDDAHGRQNGDVDLRVSEEPEEMLP